MATWEFRSAWVPSSDQSELGCLDGLICMQRTVHVTGRGTTCDTANPKRPKWISSSFAGAKRRGLIWHECWNFKIQTRTNQTNEQAANNGELDAFSWAHSRGGGSRFWVKVMDSSASLLRFLLLNFGRFLKLCNGKWWWSEKWRWKNSAS